MSISTEAALLERLTFFSDAVFAIAITLLVIEVHPPEIHPATELQLAQALVDLIPKYIGFLVSFFVIGRFWIGHHRIFGMLRRADNRLIFVNLAMLCVVAFMPFPTALISEYLHLTTAICVYSGWLLLMGVMNRAVALSALRPALLAKGYDPVTVAHVRRRTWLPIILGALAALSAFIGWLPTLLVLSIGPVIGALLLRRMERTPASA